MADLLTFVDNSGYPMIELDSDVEGGEDSSEDDIDFILHKTQEQKRIIHQHGERRKLSSEDEFEKEMNAELNQTVQTYKEQLQNKAALCTPLDRKSAMGGTSDVHDEKDQSMKYYEDVYFDSEDEGNEDSSASSPKKRNEKHKILSHDELLYDPDSDDENQKWIDNQRNHYQPATQNQPHSHKKGFVKDKRLPKSDAVLNCPACMTLLCLDCQRHAKYNNQYRAMFVKNCTVESSENLKYPVEHRKVKKSKKQKLLKTREDGEGCKEVDRETAEIYNPVKCSICKTEVGVCDKDEIFHFFNVLSSYT